LLRQEIRSTAENSIFITDRVLYITLRGRWCDNIFVNVHALTVVKSDDEKDSF